MNILKIQDTVKMLECVREKPEFLFNLDRNGNGEKIFKDSLMTYYNIKNVVTLLFWTCCICQKDFKSFVYTEIDIVFFWSFIKNIIPLYGCINE